GQSMNMMGMGGSKPIFEINPTHALVMNVKDETDDDRFADVTQILFDQAILSEGGQLDNPTEFVTRLNELLQGLLK
ncbi:MAG: molecular chaperone HtpG, partial [Methylococcales bacterium]|nr:molecular chaperone HtpG [Methylococcales bacterium]